MSATARHTLRSKSRAWRLFAACIALSALRPGHSLSALVRADDHAHWAAAARAELRAPTAAELAEARRAAQAALAEVREQLAEMPAGGVHERELELDSLHSLLHAETPDEPALRRAVAVLRGRRPGEIHASIVRLRGTTARFLADIAVSESTLAQAERAIEFFARPAAEVAASSPGDVRQAFADLARIRRLDDALETLRRLTSHPNVRIEARADYLLAAAQREFTVPISVRKMWRQTDVSATGAVSLQTRLDLLPNDERAELQIAVSGAGDLNLSAKRDRIALCGRAQPCARAEHRFAFGPHGVEVGDFDLNVSNRTSISRLTVDLPVGGRLASGVLRRALTRRLPAADRRAASAVEEQAKARIADECADIAYRMNGLFDEQLVARLAGRDLEAQPRYASSPAGIRFDAHYARRDQLAALAPPPTSVVAQMAGRDFTLWLHESAIDNLADGLENARLDESLFWMLLGEELKLEDGSQADLPTARTPVTLVLAASSPLRVRFDDGLVEVALGIRSFTAAGVTQSHAATVQVRYRVAAGDGGLRLERAGEVQIAPAAADRATLDAVLARFFPPELRPKQRFRNNSFAQWLAIERAELNDGWLAIGIHRQAPRVADSHREVAP